MLLFLSCASGERKSKTIDTADKKTAKGDAVLLKQEEIKNRDASADTLVVNKRVAVFYEPDSIQIEKKKKKIGEENYQVGLDDYAYYINESITYLEKKELPVVETKFKKYIKFILQDGTERWIKKDTLPDMWGIFLFDPLKEPYKADEMDMEAEYEKYFKMH
jgi:hypothetical protein